MVLLYLFQCHDGWLKLGVAAACPYKELQRGFWHKVHPKELCNKLQTAKLMRVWAGDYATEQALHAALVTNPDHGEFYPAERTKEIVDFVDNVCEPLELPPEPQQMQFSQPIKRACCLGRALGGHTREDHMCRSLATRGKTAPCPRCGKLISVRNDKLKQHQLGKSCKQ